MLLAVPLIAAELKVDHVTVAGRNLADLRSAFERAGIPSEYGGKHTNGMTEMAIASFGDGSYIELIAAQPASNVQGHYWGRFIDKDAGVCAWAVSVTDMRAEADRLKRAGVSISPAPSGRERPDGVALRWTTAAVGAGAAGTYFPFLIHDETPRPLRAYPRGKPSVTGMNGIALVVIAVRDLPGAIARWRKTFDLPEPRMQTDPAFKANLAWFAGTPVVLASPSEPASWLTERIKDFGEAPFAVLLGAPVKASKDGPVWFGQKIAWFDQAGLRGARIGAIER